MNGIGGFFELEVPLGGSRYHENAIALNTGRACLSYWIRQRDPKRVWVPKFNCDALFEPFNNKGVPLIYYELNEQLEIEGNVELEAGDHLIYVNYYGLKNEYVKQLLGVYSASVVLIDNTHSFFTQDPDYPSFTSARKYFGVPDGAYLYGFDKSQAECLDRFDSISITHNVKRLTGLQQEAYPLYTAYEKSLNSDCKRISLLSERLLSCVDYEHVRTKRLANYHFLHDALGEMNLVPIELLPDHVFDPFCYPFMPGVEIDREELYKKQLFIPTLWKEVLERTDGSSWEYQYASRLLPLPIDHRYSETDMQQMVSVLFEIMQ